MTSNVDRIVRGVDDVLITAELASRPSRSPDYEAESRVLGLLAEEMATNPRGVLQNAPNWSLSCAMRIPPVSAFWSLAAQAASSAGTPQQARLRRTFMAPCPWKRARVGRWMERNSVLLFHEAERFFPALKGVEPRIYENLLTPWHVKGRSVRSGPSGILPRDGSIQRMRASWKASPVWRLPPSR